MTEADRLAFESDVENYNCFSVTEASINMAGIAKLNPKQIGKALYFLLWSNLIVATSANTEFSFAALPQLDKISKNTLHDLFRDYQFTVVNPLLYSAIVDELHYLSKKTLKTVRTERRLLGHWVEIYLRGSSANKTPSLILNSKVLRQPRELGGVYEVDIESICDNLLIESSVRNKDDGEINFHIFSNGHRCVLATKDEEKTEIINGVSVCKIPYYKLAVYLDLKTLPFFELEGDSNTRISSDPYQSPCYGNSDKEE